MAITDAAADWRDARFYDHLLVADRSAFAWEWLRRHRAYHAAFALGGDSAASFGLHRLVMPSLDARIARPVWTATADPAVLIAEATAVEGDVFDLRRFADLATLVADDDGEHVLLSDGARSIRLDVIGGSLGQGAVSLSWRLRGLASTSPSLLALRRLIALTETGRFARSLHRPEARAPRWITLLRTHDALQAGASHREVACALFGPALAEPRWRVESPSYRLRVQRLAAAARAALAAAGGVGL